jgi:hypothetical protein
VARRVACQIMHLLLMCIITPCSRNRMFAIYHKVRHGDLALRVALASLTRPLIISAALTDRANSKRREINDKINDCT